MSLPLAMALRIQEALDTIAALKARTPAEIATERRLQERLAGVLDELLDRVEAGVTSRGTMPADHGSAALMLGDTTDLEEQLLEILTDEVGAAAAAAIAHVEEVVVAAATKALPDKLRPYGMDRTLFATMSSLRDRMLDRLQTRTLDALVAAADVDLPAAALRDTLGEMLEGELTQLSRHALGDVRNEATEIAERDLGVRYHMWVTAGDDKVRPAHDIDGEVQRIGEPFSNGWRRPGGLGCRCHLEPRPDLEDVPELPPGWERDEEGNPVRSAA